MPPVSAAKKKKQEHIKLFGVSNSKDRAKSSDVAAAIDDGVPAESSNSLPAVDHEDDEICEKRPISQKQADHIRSLTKVNKVYRELNEEKKKLKDEKMKNVRQGKRDHASSSNIESDDEVEKDVQVLPASQLNQLMPTDIPNQTQPSPGPSPSLLKSPQELTKSGIYKRYKNLNEQVKEQLGDEYTLVKNPVVQLSVEVAASKKVLNGMKDEHYSKLDRRVYPCLTLVKQYLKKLTEELKDQRKDGLAQFIINDINSMKEFPLETARMLLGIDGGTDCVKIVVSYPDLEDPQSVKKLRVHKAYYGKESRKELQEYLEEMDMAVKYLQHDEIETDHGLKKFICFFIADCKCGDIVIGLQGGSAMCPCLYCKIKSGEWPNLKVIPPSELRTIQEIQEAGLIIEKATEDGNLSEAKIAGLKQQQKSVYATPLMTGVPLSRFVPDPVHIDMAIVNGIITYCRNIKKRNPAAEMLLLDELERCGAALTPGRSEYNGPNCRKILKYFVEKKDIDGFAIDLLRSFAKVEAFSVARDLTEDEINNFDQAVKDFFELVDSKYPDLPGKKVKFHMLRFHVIPFVREHKSWGKFSAQALESSHRVKNSVDSIVQGKTPAAKTRQMDFFMNQQMLINYFINKGFKA